MLCSSKEVVEARGRGQTAGENELEDVWAELGQRKNLMKVRIGDPDLFGEAYFGLSRMKEFGPPCKGLAEGVNKVSAGNGTAVRRERGKQVVAIGTEKETLTVVAFDHDAEHEDGVFAAIVDVRCE